MSEAAAPIATAVVAPPPPQDQYTLDPRVFDINALSPQPEPPPPKVEPKVETPPPPPAPKHSARMLTLARELGIEQSEIDAASPADLRDAIQEVTLIRQNRPAPTPPPVAPTPPPAPVQKTGFEAIDPESIAPEIYEALKLQHEQLAELKKDREEMRKAYETLAELETRRQAESRAEQADAFFIANKDVYGDKRHHELDRASPEYIKRATVMQLAKTLKVDPKAAHALLYGAATPAPAASAAPPEPPKPVPPKDPETGKFVPRITPEQWNAGGTAIPTQRGGAAEPKGDERARKAVDAKLREMAEAGGNNHTDIAKEFPA